MSWDLPPEMSMRDYAELHQLVGAYSTCADTGRALEWVDLFTDDGVLEVALPSGASLDPWGGSIRRWVGREQLLTLATTEGPGIPGLPGSSQQHLQSNFVVKTFAKDHATSMAQLIVTAQLAGPTILDGVGPIVYTHGYYEDEWTRTSDGWRFAVRRYWPMGYHPKYWEIFAT